MTCQPTQVLCCYLQRWSLIKISRLTLICDSHFSRICNPLLSQHHVIIFIMQLAFFYQLHQKSTQSMQQKSLHVFVKAYTYIYVMLYVVFIWSKIHTKCVILYNFITVFYFIFILKCNFILVMAKRNVSQPLKSSVFWCSLNISYTVKHESPIKLYELTSCL